MGEPVEDSVVACAAPVTTVRPPHLGSKLGSEMFRMVC